jgi:aspartokinase
MVTISNVVQDILNKHVFLQEAINHNIVSYNKLANVLKPEIEEELDKKIKHNAIVMALRRYSDKLDKRRDIPTLNYFRETLLKTDVCLIIIEESPEAHNKTQELYNKMVFKQGKIFNIVQGNYELGIITNSSNKENVINAFGKNNILRIVEELVVISLMYSRDFLFTPGVLYNVLRFLTWENINIFNITLTPQELSLVISREDTMRCYNTLEKLAKTTKSS